MFKSIILKIVLALLLFEVVWCLPDGPPQPLICNPSIQLIPQHVGTAPQTTTAPVSIQVGTISYVAGATITSKKCSNFNSINSCIFITVAVDIGGNSIGSGVDNEFLGFMIQARPGEDGPAFGAFRLLPNDNKSKLFGCPDNTTFVRIKLMSDSAYQQNNI